MPVIRDEGELESIAIKETKDWSQGDDKHRCGRQRSFADAVSHEPEDKEAKGNKRGNEQ